MTSFINRAFEDVNKIRTEVKSAWVRESPNPTRVPWKKQKRVP